MFLSGWGSMQAVLAQDLKEMEKNLSAINEELSQKTKEYSWQLAAAYADYCEANNKYISWNDLPYLQQVVEYERPASLETYRLEHKASKEELVKRMLIKICTMPNERLSANIDRKLCDMRLPIIKKRSRRFRLLI